VLVKTRFLEIPPFFHPDEIEAVANEMALQSNTWADDRTNFLEWLSFLPPPPPSPPPDESGGETNLELRTRENFLPHLTSHSARKPQQPAATPASNKQRTVMIPVSSIIETIQREFAFVCERGTLYVLVRVGRSYAVRYVVDGTHFVAGHCCFPTAYFPISPITDYCLSVSLSVVAGTGLGRLIAAATAENGTYGPAFYSSARY
jgi:hypothetical protein